jgi:hypothetical protein
MSHTNPFWFATWILTGSTIVTADTCLTGERGSKQFAVRSPWEGSEMRGLPIGLAGGRIGPGRSTRSVHTPLRQGRTGTPEAEGLRGARRVAATISLIPGRPTALYVANRMR